VVLLPLAGAATPTTPNRSSTRTVNSARSRESKPRSSRNRVEELNSASDGCFPGKLDIAKKLAIVPTINSTNAMSILTLAEKPASEQIAAIERGFPSKSLDQIATMLGLSKQRIIGSLRFAQRTVSQREKTGRRFTLEESERMLRVLRAHRIVREVFATDEAVAQWLNAPDRGLGGKSPLDMLATDVGAAKVENLARAMIHGVPI